MFQLFSTSFQIQICIAIFEFSRKKNIQMSTNKPSIDPAVSDIALVILRNSSQILWNTTTTGIAFIEHTISN